MSGLRLPASASCLGRHSHLAGRGPNSNSLLPPLAAVVAVALCRQAPGRAVRHREDLLLQKSSFSGSCLIHSMEWFSELVREHDHLQCRQHLIAAEAASTAYHKIIRFATKTPPASHLCAAPGACFFLRGKLPPMSTCTKHCPEVWQAFDRLFSNDIFKNRFECGIIFVKYATKAERMLRAAEMREKPI